MAAIPTASIIQHFSTIADPRVERRKKHHLSDIFFITLCATICGADNWVAIERFGKAKEAWFTEQLGLEHGIPSHDTLGDVFAAIDTEQFSHCLSNWVTDLADVVEEDIIAMDGKCSRRSIDQGGDYVLSLKGNHGILHDDVSTYFTSALSPEAVAHTVNGGHGRIETRSVRVTDEIEWLKKDHSWSGLKSIVAGTATREVDEKVTEETRYFISSLGGNDPNKLAHAIRAHWAIENNLHWVLDLAFDEDSNRTRKGYSAAILAVIRHMALNLIHTEKTAKVGVKTKRLMAVWDNDYLLKILGVI